MKNSKFLKGVTILVLASFIGLTSCKQLAEKLGIDKEEDNGLGLLLALALLNKKKGGDPIYSGFADIPLVISQSASNASSGNNPSGLVVAGNSELENITHVFNPVRDMVKLNRDIVHIIGRLILALKRIDAAGVSDIKGRGTWGDDDQPAIYWYQPDSTYGAGGRKLEVWWDSAVAPFNSLKAVELVFLDPNPGNSKTEDIKGHIWARFLNEETGNSLGMASIDFEYFAADDTGNIKVVIQDVGVAGNNNAHMYVSRSADGLTSIDGTFTVNGFVEGINDSSSDRAYVFAASGSDDLKRAVVKSAFPLLTNSDSSDAAVYDPGETPVGVINSFAEIYTDWFMFNPTILAGLIGLGGSCAGLTAPVDIVEPAPNQQGMSGSDAAAFLTCMDWYRLNVDASEFSDVYYVPNIKNPGYYKKYGKHVHLEAVGTAPDSSYSSISLRSGIRTGADIDYSADFTASGVDTLDIIADVASYQWINVNNTPPAL